MSALMTIVFSIITIMTNLNVKIDEVQATKNVAVECEAVAEVKSEVANETKEIKRRGRPAGSKNKVKTTSDSNITTIKEEAKKRGRPAGSKNKAKEENNVEFYVVEEIEKTIEETQIEEIQTDLDKTTTETTEATVDEVTPEENITAEQPLETAMAEMEAIKTEATKNRLFPVINDKFKLFIPPLSQETYDKLKKNIEEYGIMNPIITWKNQIIDGHHRFAIAQQLGIPFEVKEFEFANENEVFIWIFNNQDVRRNLSKYDFVLLALKLKPIFEEKAKANQKLAGLASGKGSEKGLLKSTKAIEPVNSREEVAKIAGVSGDTVRKVDFIQNKAIEEVKTMIRNNKLSLPQAEQAAKLPIESQQKLCRDMAEGIGFGKALSNAKINTKRELFALREPQAVEGKYDVIYADCPFPYKNCPNNSIDPNTQYPTMSIEKICEFNDYFEVAEDAILFFWITAPLLPFAFEIAKKWGFKDYKSQIVWDKVNPVYAGGRTQTQHENLLIFTRGKFPAPLAENAPRSVYTEKKTEHSKKPEYFYEMIEKMVPASSRKLEVFARGKVRDGWNAIGNQIEEDTTDNVSESYCEKCSGCEKSCKSYVSPVSCTGFREIKESK